MLCEDKAQTLAVRDAMYVSCSGLYRMCCSVAGVLPPRQLSGSLLVQCQQVGIHVFSVWVSIFRFSFISFSYFRICVTYMCLIAAVHQMCMTLLGFWVDAPEVVSSCGSRICRFVLYTKNCRED